MFSDIKDIKNVATGSIITIAAVLATIAVFWGIYFLISHLLKKHIFRNSAKINNLIELNNKTDFYPLQETIHLVFHCNSKSQYDRFNLKENIISRIARQQDLYSEILEKCKSNNSLYEKYNEQVIQIFNMPSSKKRSQLFRNLENKYLLKMRYNPVIDFQIRGTKKYITPKGRHYYHQDEFFSKDIILLGIELSKKVAERKLNVQQQRNLMTDSLRYNVMRRDRFRCVLCGATAEDGVKLHVDHILPVSKGGKTEMKNLRTLCERCNLGKSDKYRPTGKN